MAVKTGPKVSVDMTYSDLIQTPTWTWLYFDGQRGFISVYIKYTTWREHAYNDPTLHLKAELVRSSSRYYATNRYTHFYEAKAGFGGKEGRDFYESGSMNAPLFPEVDEEYFTETMRGFSFETTVENKDQAPDAESAADLDYWLIDDKKFNAWIYGYIYIYDESTDWSGTVHEGRHVRADLPILYPPYRPFPAGGSDSFPSTSANGSIDVSDGKTKLTNWWSYPITKSGYTNYLNYSPTTTKGSYNESITSSAIIEGTTYDVTGSSRKSYTHYTTGDSYSGYIKRYYTNYSDIYTTSATAKAYTYSVPELSSISLNKETISPRSGAELIITLKDMDHKVWNIENTYRTGIWSNIKGKYYIDEASTSSTRTLSAANVIAMFPDSSASNGEVNGTVYVTRRNIGVKDGNPGKDTLIYETDARTDTIKVQYKPTVPIDPDSDPSGDESKSGLAFYKNENRTQGAQLPKGKTWTLPNTYNINNMTGVNVKIQYPKTDASGVLSGYKIELLLPNDGTHANDYVWYTTYWNTTNYTYTGTISYNDLKRGISGNRIRITPYYIPNGVTNKNNYWYGPSVVSKFVDISWMLNKPVIDCPLTGTTWHNHHFRVLFKLPKDRDTEYKAPDGKTINDIEVHYGSGKYRYQEIQIKINGTETLMANNAYMNAQNNWAGPTSVNNAKLTYLRPININPSLINTFKDDGTFSISIRIRKAYGQNTDSFTGWSEWSDDIVVSRKTVTNIAVVKHEPITAVHYMRVQEAYNKSTACYAKTASDNKNFVVKESFNRVIGDNINGPHLTPPQNTPLGTIKEYVSEFNDAHQLKNKINGYATFDTDKDRTKVRLDCEDKLLATFTPSQEFITAAKDQEGTTECREPENPAEVLKGRNYMKYMCDELNKLK